MADTTLSSIPLGKSADYYYGIKNSLDARFHAQGIVNARDFCAGDNSTDDTSGMQNALSEALGCAVVIGGTGGVSSTTFTATTVHGTIKTGTRLRYDGAFGQPDGIIQAGGSGGPGTYTISPALNIPNGTTCFVSNGGDYYKNKKLYIPGGRYRLKTLYVTSTLQGMIEGAGCGVTQLIHACDGTEGQLFSVGSINTFTPLLSFEGWNCGAVKNLSMIGTAPTLVYKYTSAGSTTGSTTLHIADTTGIKKNMAVYSVNNTAGTSDGAAARAIVASDPTGDGTVTLDWHGTTPSGPINSGDLIIFVSSTVGIWAQQAGWAAMITSEIDFDNIEINNFGNGLLAGFGSPGGNCEDFQFNQCKIRNNAHRGILALSQNTLNWGVFGGEYSGNGLGSTCQGCLNSGNSGGAIVASAGTVPIIAGAHFFGNNWDIFNGSGCGHSVVGCSFDGGGVAPQFCNFTGFIDNGSGGAGHTLHVTAVAGGTIIQGGILDVDSGLTEKVYIKSFGTGTGGVGTYTLSGSTQNVSSRAMTQNGRLVNRSILGLAPFALQGCTFTGVTPGDTLEAFRYIDSGGAAIVATGCTFAPATDGGTNGIFCFISNGSLVLDACVFKAAAQQGIIKGITDRDRLYMRANVWQTTKNAALYTFSGAGGVAQFLDVADVTVATLPTASAAWKSCPPIAVVDLDFAYNGSTSLNTNVSGHGGGTNVGWVACPSGSAWITV